MKIRRVVIGAVLVGLVAIGSGPEGRAFSSPSGRSGEAILGPSVVLESVSVLNNPANDYRRERLFGLDVNRQAEFARRDRLDHTLLSDPDIAEIHRPLVTDGEGIIGVHSLACDLCDHAIGWRRATASEGNRDGRSAASTASYLNLPHGDVSAQLSLAGVDAVAEIGLGGSVGLPHQPRSAGPDKHSHPRKDGGKEGVERHPLLGLNVPVVEVIGIGAGLALILGGVWFATRAVVWGGNPRLRESVAALGFLGMWVGLLAAAVGIGAIVDALAFGGLRMVAWDALDWGWLRWRL